MATNLFKQWNPLKNNQKSDVAYESDVQRSGGAVSGVHPASTFNKLAYQMSTFIYSLAEAMKNKGYNMSDADPAALTTILEEILTKADQIQSDWNQTASAEMDFIKNKPTITDPVNADWNAVAGLAQILNKPSLLTSANFEASLATNGYQKLPSGLMIQWGLYDSTISGETSVSVTFPISFVSACYNVTATPKINASNATRDLWVQVISITKLGASLQTQSYTGATSIDGFYWFAIGV